MGFFDNVPVASDVEDAAGTVVTGAIDVPADAINAATGTGNNLGFFGDVDRALDPRNIDEDDVPDPNPSNTGISGFLRGAGGAAGGGAEQVAGAAGSAVLRSPALLVPALLAVVFVVGQLLNVSVGGE
jgi:hypothetical protein